MSQLSLSTFVDFINGVIQDEKEKEKKTLSKRKDCSIVPRGGGGEEFETGEKKRVWKFLSKKDVGFEHYWYAHIR